MNAPKLSEEVLAKIREEALVELRETKVRPPLSVRPWRIVAGWYTAAVAGLTGVALAVSAGLGLYGEARLGAQLVVVASLAIAQAVAIWVAVAPFSWRRTFLAVGCALVAIVLMLGWRPSDPTAFSPRPGWICSASHLAVDVLPLAVALVALRQGVMRPGRVIAGGIAAGALGALLGELACERGRWHVMVHHLGVWLAVVAVCMLIARRMRPTTYTP